MITENAHMMLSYLELLTRVRNEDNLIEEWGLGDWYPNGRGLATNCAVPLGFVNGVTIMDMCRKAVVMFDAVGLKLHSAFAKALGEETRIAVRKRYVDFATMTIEGCYQTGQAMAVYYDLLEEGEKKQAVDVLVDIIHKNDDHFSVGHLGARCLFHVLSTYGYADLAYKMITRLDPPSYGVIIPEGFTTLPESFLMSYEYDKQGSLNHHFFGDIKHWYLRSVVGINVNPDLDNPDEIFIKPCFIEALDFAEGSYKTPNGSIYVKWLRDGENIRLIVRKEGSVKFTTRLPNGYVFEDTILSWRRNEDEIDNAMVIKKIL